MRFSDDNTNFFKKSIKHKKSLSLKKIVASPIQPQRGGGGDKKYINVKNNINIAKQSEHKVNANDISRERKQSEKTLKI